MSIEFLKAELEKLVSEHKKYSEKSETKPPPNFIGGYWSPSDGSIRMVYNQKVSNNYFNSQVGVGVAIGGMFSSKNREVRVELFKKIKLIINSHIKNHGGFYNEIDGTSYSIYGYQER